MTQPQAQPTAPRRLGAVIKPQTFRPPPRGPALPRIEIAWLPLTVSLVLLAWMLAAWFVFTARAVTLHTEPVNAELEVAEWLAPRIARHWLLRPGEHRVHASAPGYQPFAASIMVNDTPIQTHDITLERLPGHLRIALTPEVPAEVLIDNLALGTAPGVVRDIPAGMRQVEVRAPRYRPHFVQLDIEGKGIEQSLAPILEPAWADISVDTQPTGAQIRVDGQRVATTPYAGELIEGRRVLTLTRAGYKPWQQTLKVVAGTTVKLGTVVLLEADGQLRLQSTPGGASVTLDDNFVGRTPLDLAIAAGKAHRLHLFAEGYLPAERSVTLAAAGRETLAVALEAELANVRFVTTPPTAELLIDGAPRGSANQTLPLPTREHEVTVRALGYATYTTRITPRKAVEKRFTIRLKTSVEMGVEAAAPGTTSMNIDNAAAGNAGGDTRDNVDSADHEAAPAKLTTFAGQELKLFSGGQVVLGSPPADAARASDEVERAVRLQRAFYLGAKEVSNGEYRRFLANHHAAAVQGASLDDDSQPVVDVDWHGAALYCNWLSRRDGLPPFYQIKYGEVLGVNPAATGYRLPTEAEWEWAARVAPNGTATVYAWGDRYPPASLTGNYADDAAQSVVKNVLRGLRDGFAISAPVGSFSANLRGLYDLDGNVAEWVHDYYDARPSATATVDPLGPPSGTQHVIKGASWAQSSSSALRFAARVAAERGRNDVGFRLARYAQ